VHCYATAAGAEGVLSQPPFATPFPRNAYFQLREHMRAGSGAVPEAYAYDAAGNVLSMPGLSEGAALGAGGYATAGGSAVVEHKHLSGDTPTLNDSPQLRAQRNRPATRTRRRLTVDQSACQQSGSSSSIRFCGWSSTRTRTSAR
jgi:hypothetical protein